MSWSFLTSSCRKWGNPSSVPWVLVDGVGRVDGRLIVKCQKVREVLLSIIQRYWDVLAGVGWLHVLWAGGCSTSLFFP